MRGIIFIADLFPKQAPAHWHIGKYRSGFHSLIKKAIQEFDGTLYRYYFESVRPVVKPYTFAVLFPKAQFQKDTIYFHKLRFFFVSPDPEWIVAITNFFSSLQEYTLLETPLLVKKLNQHALPTIESPAITVNTISPVVIRSANNPNHYVVPECVNNSGDPGFEESLRFNVLQTVQALRPDLVPAVESIALKPLECRFTVVKYVKNNTLLKFPAFKGRFVLKGTPALLSFILSVGLGSRRSQGFGMLELTT